MKSRRQFIQPIAAVALLSPLLGCAAGSSMERKMIGFHFVTRNYTDRDIFELQLNGHGWSGAPPYGGGNGVMMGSQFELGGPQILKWRDSGTGATLIATNQLYIREEDIPKGAKTLPYMCIHIYPDQTAEITYGLGTEVDPGVRTDLKVV